MKFNWGTGIFIFYTIFASFLAFQVYKSTTYDHYLVTENYYEKDLAYQQLYEKKQNSLNLEEPLAIQYEKSTNQVILTFPKEMTKVKGDILFYRADDKKQDAKFAIETNNQNQMIIPTQIFKSGYWNVEVDWATKETLYFDEKEILL